MNRLLADARWTATRARQLVEAAAVTPFRELPSDLPRRFSRTRRLADRRVPMRDGVELAADVYLPDARGPFPAVLIRMPYGKREAYCSMPAHGKYWARLGYACVVQDVRGRWGSSGEFVPFVNEADDGWDTLDWVAAQPWCDGDVGMTGESYYGYTQWAVATLGHPHLRCIAPGDTAADVSSSWIYVGGAFCHQTMGRWAYDINGRRDQNDYRFDPWHLPTAEAAVAAGAPSQTYAEWVTRSCQAATWQHIDVGSRSAGVCVPALHWGGWYDVFLTGTISGWHGARTAGDPQVRARQFLSIGATDHELTPELDGVLGRHRLRGHGYAHDRVARFMDQHLTLSCRAGVDGHLSAGLGRPGPKGDAGAGPGGVPVPTTRQPVQYYTPGRGEWQTTADWPPSGAERRRFHLHSDGRADAPRGGGWLSADRPGDEPPDRYLYDPATPVTYWLGTNLWEAARYLADRRSVEARADVLVYTSEPLSRAVEVTGPLEATLHVSTSAPDTDFTVALVDVSPDGHAHLVQEGIQRLRYRDGHPAGALVLPGDVVELHVDLWATSYLFAAGHRLRVEVSSSNFDRYDRNLNTADEPGLGVDMAVAAQTVFHDARRPSYVTLSVIDE